LKRKVIDELIKWKTLNSGMPILLTGAKGVGKTYLAYDFAKTFFEHIFYLNFERDLGASKLFQTADPKKIEEQLKDHYKLDLDIPSENRILILDEISCCKEVMQVLKSMQLPGIFSYIIAISSNPIPDEYRDHIPQLPIYPLEFDEFLRATSSEWYIETVIHHFNANKKIPEIVHKELLALHQLYLQIGGMPSMVNEYLSLTSTVNVAERHSFLIGSYHDCILKDNPDSDALKMNQVFDSLVLQLQKDNKKFQYKLIRKGTTHSMYKDAISKLKNNNYVIRCNRISNEQLLDYVTTFASREWSNEEANTNFKLYLPDIGMLYTKMAEEQGRSFDHNHKKALLENYVAQSLQAKNYPFGFWESDSMAKIDFIVLKGNEIIPIEIYDSDNTRSKSLSVLKQKCDFPYSIKISSKNFDFSNQIKYVPYYAVFCL
jgi:predicted AAA+ superfamily ATPase